LKNFSTCLLSWSKFTSQLDAPGFMDCCTWTAAHGLLHVELRAHSALRPPQQH
jgi:hypothetical protein